MPDSQLSVLMDRDPKQVGFRFARYKFVAKMLAGFHSVLEVGCGNGFCSRVVAQGVIHLTATDPQIQHTERVPSIGYMNYDIIRDEPPGRFDAVYVLDVFEHIKEEELLMQRLRDLAPVCIIGTPSLESQRYASEGSKLGHVNCVSGEYLRAICKRKWKNVFMFSMNDEVLHTGFLPMAHYLFALCVE